jgi:hypothetical protein
MLLVNLQLEYTNNFNNLSSRRLSQAMLYSMAILVGKKYNIQQFL